MRFRLFDIPFHVRVEFWIGMALLGGLGGGFNDDRALARLAIWVVCGFLSIVVHELGHALAGRRYGAAPHVELYMMGGLTFLPGARFDRWRGILVSLAGPAFGLGLWLLVHALNGILAGRTAGSFVIGQAFEFLAYINLYWTLFNLLPILPLDGGQVVRDLLGPRHIQTARALGATVAGFLAVLALFERQWFIAIFLGSLAVANARGNARSLPGGVQT